jgi:hypothetical protein
MKIDMKFLMNYQNVVARLAVLLDTRFLPGSRSHGGIIDQRLAGIMQAFVEDRQLERDIEFTLIIFLLAQLERIAEYDMALLKIFRPALTSPRADDYFGTRMEINITSSLIKQNAKFEKRESPDFAFYSEKELAFLECTSVHLKSLKEMNAVYKINSAIEKKSQKSYCNPTTALCIDVTNITYSNLAIKQILANAETRQRVQEQLKTSAFGSILLFTYIFDMDAQQLNSSYMRIDNPRIAFGLESVLNRYFPFGQYSINSYRIPPSG